MATSKTNTYDWYVNKWDNRDHTYGTVVSAVGTSVDWSATLFMSVLPSHSGVVIPSDDQTMTGNDNYFFPGFEISLMTEPRLIMLRHNPSTSFESTVSTKTLIPPAILPRPSSTSNDDAQTAPLISITDSTSSGNSELGSGAIATQSENGSQSPVATSGSNSGNPSLSGGAIAGIVAGAIIILVSIIGGWFFWQRRKRAKENGLSSGDEEQIRREEDAMVTVKQHSLQEKQHIHELPGRDQAQELDPSHSSEYAMSGARRSAGKAQYNHGPAYELHPDSHPGELPSRVDEQTSKAHHQHLGPAVTTTDATEMTGTLSDTTSPHIEAQRRREIKWLEMEEERIRKRRETLASQGSAKT